MFGIVVDEDEGEEQVNIDSEIAWLINSAPMNDNNDDIGDYEIKCDSLEAQPVPVFIQQPLMTPTTHTPLNDATTSIRLEEVDSLPSIEGLNSEEMEMISALAADAAKALGLGQGQTDQESSLASSVNEAESGGDGDGGGDGGGEKKPRRKRYYSWYGARRPNRPQSKSGKVEEKPPMEDVEEEQPDPLAAFLPTMSGDDDSLEHKHHSKLPSRLPSLSTSSRSVEAKEESQEEPLTGLTRQVFNGESAKSPYVDHLKFSTKLQGLYASADAYKPASARRRVSMSKMVTEEISQLSKTEKEKKVIEKDRKEALDRKNQMLTVYKRAFNTKYTKLPQMQPDAIQRVDESRPYPRDGRPKQPNNAGGVNQQSSQIARASSPQGLNKQTVSVDDLLGGQIVLPQQRSRVAASNIDRNDATATTFLDKKIDLTNINSSLLTVSMMSNIHVDPLYRIVREEVDRLRDEGGSGSSAAADSSQRVNVSDIKMLSYFTSLPPAVWVTCRIVYFLLVAYYETVVSKPEFVEYRKMLNLEKIWKVLERQSVSDGICLDNAAKQFSWPYLQELMRLPTAFIKALEYVEKGLRLHPSEWVDFQSVIAGQQDDGAPAAASVTSNSVAGGSDVLPRSILVSSNTTVSSARIHALQNVVDDHSSQQLFLNLFPERGFLSLRELVKAGRAVLLTGSSSLYSKASKSQSSAHLPSSGQSHVPGSPLAVSASLTAWAKRIIASLYITSIHRARDLTQTTQLQCPPSSHRQTTSMEMIKAAASQNERQLQTKTDRGLSPMKDRLPPGLTVATVMNHFVHQQTVSRLNAFIQFLLSIIKPCDQLDLLLLGDIQSSGDVVLDQQSLCSILEQYLRVTSASPLHKVVVVPPASSSSTAVPDGGHQISLPGSSSDRYHYAHLPANIGHYLSVLSSIIHPGLSYCLYGNRYVTSSSHKPSAHHLHHRSAMPKLDLFITDMDLMHPNCYIYRDLLRQQQNLQHAELIEEHIR
eukprot:scaffold268_cov210-Ochromonas_danica.AAC.49